MIQQYGQYYMLTNKFFHTSVTLNQLSKKKFSMMTITQTAYFIFSTSVNLHTKRYNLDLTYIPMIKFCVHLHLHALITTFNYISDTDK